MDIRHFRERLKAEEQDLLKQISRFENEARNSRSADVEGSIDEAISSEGKAAAFEESTLAAQKLSQVRDAFARMDNGTYGTCIDCGREIEPARLEAVPWTPYCLAVDTPHG